MAKVHTHHKNNPTQDNDFFNGKNTLRILMLFCLFYIITQGNFAFQFGENKFSSDTASDTQFGFGEPNKTVPLPRPKPKTVALASTYKAKETKGKVETVTTNAANKFHNIAFLLDEKLADKYTVAPEFVRAKKQICEKYVKKFTPVAKVEQDKFGIPVSITLAQGLLESDAGESRLALAATNHFGIKCFSNHCKKGHCKNFTDDTHKDFFINYQNAWQSFRAHSEFLKQNRYKKLFVLNKKDYKGWAKGLRASGYATDLQYDMKLIKIIEALKLYQLD
jgi:flagellum-specific peptidoglycan hydrolase FlgJ